MTEETDNVDRKELQSLYKGSGAAKAILDYFAARERNWSETTVDRVLAKLNQDENRVPRWAAIEVFRRLEELGCGRFVAGRRRHPSRFQWSANLVHVGRAASGEPVNIESASTEVVNGPADDLLEHRFRLRKELDITLGLPADLNATEAARLAAFIQTLPFDTNHA